MILSPFFTLPTLFCFFFLFTINNFYAVAGSNKLETCSDIVALRHRGERISITEFGGVGDGKTLNTKAFKEAIYRIQHLKRRGGTLLYVPPGVYLTESFNLTSHMTLYLAAGTVIKATQELSNWPLIAPLPSYGRGRELPGGRYMSFIHGDGVHDVVITGENGTIDGQGEVWWNMWRQKTLQFTRPNLVEFMHSRNIIISNVIFKDSPFWNIHPVYCSNVVVRFVTILAPHDSPNTDGVDPGHSFFSSMAVATLATALDRFPLLFSSGHHSGYPISLKHPSLVCFKPPQCVHFIWVLSSMFLWDDDLALAVSDRPRTTKPLSMPEGSLPINDSWRFMIPRRAISLLIVA